MFKSIVLAAFVAALAVNPVFAGDGGCKGGNGGSPSPSPSPSPAPSASAAPSAGPTGGAGQHTWEDWLPGDPIKVGGKTLKSVNGKNVLNGCGAKNKNCLW